MSPSERTATLKLLAVFADAAACVTRQGADSTDITITDIPTPALHDFVRVVSAAVAFDISTERALPTSARPESVVLSSLSRPNKLLS